MNLTKVKTVAISPPSSPTPSYIPPPILEGTPILVDKSKGQIIQPVLIFILNTGRGSSNTNNAKVDDLRDWFDFLDEIKAYWLNVNTEEIELYINIMLNTISSRNKTYSPKTISRRVSTIEGFYQFWRKEGLYTGSINKKTLETYHSLDSNSLVHLGNAKKKKSNFYDRKGNSDNKTIDVMTPNVWSDISSFLGPLSSGHRLIWETALQTGMRIHEVLNLTAKQILSFRKDSDNPAAKQMLRITAKGNKPHTVLLPNWLILELRKYCDKDRQNTVNACLKAIKHYREPVLLFINLSHQRYKGYPISQRTALRRFNQAVLKAGYIREAERIDTKTGDKYYVKEAMYVGHSTRHTYAIWTYYIRKSQGDHEPWKHIQIRLGHASLKTTMDTYLRSADDFEQLISDKTMVDLRTTINS